MKTIYTFFVLGFVASLQAADFEPLRYGVGGLETDLAVGLWALPLPMDYDGDGDYDLVVSTVNKPSSGVYFFENPGGEAKFPLFKPGVRVGDARGDVTVSYVDGKPLVLTPGKEYPQFKTELLASPRAIDYKPTFYAGRGNHWYRVDYDGDGVLDLVIGVGDWREYGWDDAFDAQGHWTRGPLHGYVYFVRNTGSNERPKYAAAEQVMAGGKPLDVFGSPSPQLADFDGDGDLDLICGEFLDRLNYFENTGTRTSPQYAAARFVAHDGRTIHMDLEMIEPVAIDWDRDGDVDLIVGQEDGRVALVENTGRRLDGMPEFEEPRFFRQQAELVKCGVLATPCGCDWDGDGDQDIVSGDSAGYVQFVENLDGGNPPRFALAKLVEADGKVIRIQAGENGSIQGPAEAKWGYTVLGVADWNHDGRLDIVLNSIWGELVWYENVGSPTAARLKAAQKIEVAWNGKPPKPAWNWWSPKGKQLVTQWRTTPAVYDLNRDGLNDLVMLDHEGYLTFFKRERTEGQLRLLPGERIFQDDKGQPLQLNAGRAGKSGRRKFVLADWDQDGRLDILINGKNVDLLRNVSNDGGYRFKNEGPVANRILAGHDTCPTVVDWDRNGVPDLVVGAEDGFLYYLINTKK